MAYRSGLRILSNVAMAFAGAGFSSLEMMTPCERTSSEIALQLPRSNGHPVWMDEELNGNKCKKHVSLGTTGAFKK
jgi:hypothetical protein